MLRLRNLPDALQDQTNQLIRPDGMPPPEADRMRRHRSLGRTKDGGGGGGGGGGGVRARLNYGRLGRIGFGQRSRKDREPRGTDGLHCEREMQVSNKTQSRRLLA